jgi:hypothetical protein
VPQASHAQDCGEPPVNISLRNISLRNISLRNISLRNISLRNISLRNISLRNISLRKIALRKIAFRGPTLQKDTSEGHFRRTLQKDAETCFGNVCKYQPAYGKQPEKDSSPQIITA